VLESCLYAEDLDAAARFYADVIGLRQLSRVPGRHVFFRCGDGVVLIFDARRTSAEQTSVGGAPVPLHGARGAGHLAFAVPDAELPRWREHLATCGVAVESEVAWPDGGHSIYVRDPAGNSIELASPTIWGIAE
jgi:catechol 2,3-dioxygenase-like lactoylglutathione lyase family enzyme